MLLHNNEEVADALHSKTRDFNQTEQYTLRLMIVFTLCLSQPFEKTKKGTHERVRDGVEDGHEGSTNCDDSFFNSNHALSVWTSSYGLRFSEHRSEQSRWVREIYFRPHKHPPHKREFREYIMLWGRGAWRKTHLTSTYTLPILLQLISRWVMILR